MDLTKELNEIDKFKGGNPDSLINYVLEQNKMMQKKIHLLYVMNITKTIDELAKQKIFEKDEVCFLEIYTDEDCALYDKSNCYIMEDNSSYDLLKKLFKNNAINLAYTSKNINKRIDLREDVQEQIYKMFLSKELRTILEYNEMNINLKCSEEKHQQAKLKV